MTPKMASYCCIHEFKAETIGFLDLEVDSETIQKSWIVKLAVEKNLSLEFTLSNF